MRTPVKISAAWNGMILAAALVGVLASLWAAWVEFPFYWWNDMRLAPAFALRLGLNPYPLIGGGPLFTWIYGPIGILINLPATWAGSPIGAIRIAGVINALVVLSPLAVYFFASAELRTKGQLTCWLAFAFAILLVPRFNLILQVADHCAIAAGLMANWLLARRAIPSTRVVLLAAVAVTVAIWSKQLAVFLPFAQVAYLLIHRLRTTCWRFVTAVLVMNVLALVLFTILFGWQNLWLNLVEIPARLGWADVVSRLAHRPGMLAVQIGLPALVMLAVWKTQRWPRADRESGRLFQLSVLSFWVMLPIGLLAFFKTGGDINLIYGWDYMMPAMLLVWLSNSATHLIHRSVIAGLALASHYTDLAWPPSQPFTQQFNITAEIAAKHRGAVWFPQNPVVGFYANGQLHHTEDGVSTRYLAGYGIREREFRAFLPQPLEAVVYPIVNNEPFSRNLLPELDHQFRYPYWMVYARGDWEDDKDATISKSPAATPTR